MKKQFHWEYSLTYSLATLGRYLGAGLKHSKAFQIASRFPELSLILFRPCSSLAPMRVKLLRFYHLKQKYFFRRREHAARNILFPGTGKMRKKGKPKIRN